MAIYRSSRGTPVDLDALRMKQETNISVGNTKTNARGDILGKGGRIEKSADQIAREHYNRNNPKAVKKASIKLDDEVKAEVVKEEIEDDWVEPEVEAVEEDTDEDEWIEDEDGNFVKKEDK